jgi:hypothetical protein
MDILMDMFGLATNILDCYSSSSSSSSSNFSSSSSSSSSSSGFIVKGFDSKNPYLTCLGFIV